jgi:hypothetical protein
MSPGVTLSIPPVTVSLVPGLISEPEIHKKSGCLERWLEMTACLGQSCFNRVLYAIVVSQLVACGGSGGGGSATGVSTGSIALKWVAPATRADGAPMSLAEIGGFRIYYWKSVAGSTNVGDVNVVDVNDGVATSANLIDIPVGNYSLVMTTYDAAGRESIFSSVVPKTVQ